MKCAGLAEIECLQGPRDDLGWCSRNIDHYTVFIGGQWFQCLELEVSRLGGMK
jgi:hypothetical protein